MQIVFAASECAPWARTGGLGEVVRSPVAPDGCARPPGLGVPALLPAGARAGAGEEVRNPQRHDSFPVLQPFRGDSGRRPARWRADVLRRLPGDVRPRVALRRVPSGDYADNWERFGLFCRAVLEASKQLGVPDVFHVHDWQASLVPVYLKTLYSCDPGAAQSRRPCSRSTTPDTRGCFPPQTVGTAAVSLGNIHHGPRRALRQIQFSQGRHRLLRFADHGEPSLCRRDSDTGVRRGPRERVAEARCGPGGNSEWRRLLRSGIRRRTATSPRITRPRT